MKRCDAVFLMRGWEKSKGARAEHDVAKGRMMKVFYDDIQPFLSDWILGKARWRSWS